MSLNRDKILFDNRHGAYADAHCLGGALMPRNRFFFQPEFREGGNYE